MREVFNPIAESKAAKEFEKKLQQKPVTVKEEGKAHTGETEPEAKAKKPKVKTGPSGPFINKYGFLHVNGNLAKHLGIELGKDKANVPVTVEPIENGFIVRLKV